MWKERIEAFFAELNEHPDIEVRIQGVIHEARPAQLERAEQAFGSTLPAGIRELYAELDGFTVRWQHRTLAHVQGGVNVGPVLRTFELFEIRSFDFVSDLRPAQNLIYYAGFDPNGDPNDLLWVYFGEKDKPGGHKEARSMSLTLEHYLDALLHSRGFAFWQEAFTPPATVESPASENVALMNEVLPDLFGDFDPASFGSTPAEAFDLD